MYALEGSDHLRDGTPPGSACRRGSVVIICCVERTILVTKDLRFESSQHMQQQLLPDTAVETPSPLFRMIIIFAHVVTSSHMVTPSSATHHPRATCASAKNLADLQPGRLADLSSEAACASSQHRCATTGAWSDRKKRGTATRDRDADAASERRSLLAVRGCRRPS